jgi:gamma-glutamyl-gamma-aminobutyraldehyde dehydrogenase
MSMTLLTRDEYAAIAADLTRRAPPSSTASSARHGRQNEDCQPGHRQNASPKSPPAARRTWISPSSKAREAFDQGRWSTLHPVRAQGCADPSVQADHPQPPRAGGDGKPRQRQADRDCETIDIPETIHCIKWHAEADRQDL